MFGNRASGGARIEDITNTIEEMEDKVDSHILGTVDTVLTI